MQTYTTTTITYVYTCTLEPHCTEHPRSQVGSYTMQQVHTVQVHQIKTVQWLRIILVQVIIFTDKQHTLNIRPYIDRTGWPDTKPCVHVLGILSNAFTWRSNMCTYSGVGRVLIKGSQRTVADTILQLTECLSVNSWIAFVITSFCVPIGKIEVWAPCNDCSIILSVSKGQQEEFLQAYSSS